MADALQTLGRGAQITVALGAAYLLALWFVLVVWTFRDIEARSRSVLTQVFSTLLVVLFFVPGVLLYLILRPKQTLDEAFQRSLEEEYLLQDLEELPLCGNCHRYVEDDFVLCPHCHSTLREGCQACGRLVDLRWALCPYCGARQLDGESSVERVEAPAARWSAPSLRRRRANPEPRPTPAERRRPAALREVVAEQPVGPVAAPAADAVAANASGDGAEAKGLSVMASMRSIARPFDRFRARSGDDLAGTETVAGASPSGAVKPNGWVSTTTNGSGAADQAHRLFDALNGERAASPPPPVSLTAPRNGSAANGHHAHSNGTSAAERPELAAGPEGEPAPDAAAVRDGTTQRENGRPLAVVVKNRP